jgi:hypothetical protein
MEKRPHPTLFEIQKKIQNEPNGHHATERNQCNIVQHPPPNPKNRHALHNPCVFLAILAVPLRLCAKPMQPNATQIRRSRLSVASPTDFNCKNAPESVPYTDMMLSSPPRVLLALAALAILMEHPAAAQSPRYETLYSFKGTPDGADPKGALLIGKSGELYGTTFGGGTSVFGTVFHADAPTGQPWKETILHSFTGSDGQYPQSALTPVIMESSTA